MKSKTWLQRRADVKIGKPGFETQRLLLRLTEAFAERMEQREVRRVDLAREMDVDRAMVTRILNGDQNVTIKTLVTMACALNSRLDFELYDLVKLRTSTEEAMRHRLHLAYDGVERGMPTHLLTNDLRVQDATSTTYTIGLIAGATVLNASSNSEGEREATAA